MNGPAKITRTDIARYFALLQPPLITDRLFEDASFQTEFGVAARDAIAFGGGPAILKSALYAGVRRMFAEERPQALTALNGATITVSSNGDHVALSFVSDGGANTTVDSLNLMFLSSKTEVRQAALRRATNELGPTGPDPVYWHKELQDQGLDDARMDQYLRQIDASIVSHLARVVRDCVTGVLDKTHMVPRSIAYWESLCGPQPGRMDQETWLKEVFEPQRRRLIERDLVRGLDLCLAMGIREDLTPRAITAHLSDDDLWNALEQLGPIDDPFSLVGIVDLAASRCGDERFAARSAETLRRLCGGQLCRADGLDVYAFLPALVDLVRAELQVMASIASRPAFWRRICAWTQAALLVRAFQAVRMDPEPFSENIKLLQAVEAQTAELLDLRQSPLSHPAENSRECIRAEIFGRLLLVQKRLGEEGQNLPGADALAAAVKDPANAIPYFSQMPGPLELDRLPCWELDTLPEECDEFKTGLRARANELTSDANDQNWLLFFHLSRLFRFDDHIFNRISALITATNFGVSDDERQSALTRMFWLSYVAVEQRNASMAEAILTRCLQWIGAETNEHHATALFRIGCIATAASGQDSVTKDRFGKYLRDLVFLLPKGDACRALSAEIEVLKAFTPLGEWQNYAQAEALALLGW